MVIQITVLYIAFIHDLVKAVIGRLPTDDSSLRRGDSPLGT